MKMGRIRVWILMLVITLFVFAPVTTFADDDEVPISVDFKIVSEADCEHGSVVKAAFKSDSGTTYVTFDDKALISGRVRLIDGQYVDVRNNIVIPYIPALGHEKESYTEDPTCGEYGYTYDMCKRCRRLIYHATDMATDYIDPIQVAYNRTDPVIKYGEPCEYQWKVIYTDAHKDSNNDIEALVCINCGHILPGSETVIPKPIIGTPEPPYYDIIIDKNLYTADSIKAIKEAKEMLNQAIVSGTADDVKRASDRLQQAIDNAVLKSENRIKASAKKITVSVEKNKIVSAKKAFKVKDADGRVTYKKKSNAGGSKIKVAKDGTVTIKKGLKKGKTYKVKVNVTAAGDGNYLAKTNTVILKVKISK